MLGSWSSDVHRALQLIQSDDPDLKLQAADEIIWLAFFSQSCEHQLSGSIKPLVSMLRVDSPDSHRDTALLALLNLAANDNKNRIKIVESGALEPIISFLQSQTLKLQESATEFLLLLSAPYVNKPVIGSSGVIPLLVKILGHESQEVKVNAMKALLNLSEEPNNLNIIQGTNPIPPIFNWLEKCFESSESFEIVEMCCALIESLVGFDEGNALTEYLMGFDEWRIAWISEEGRMLAIPPLVKILRHGSSEAKMNAMEALLKLSTNSENLKFILGTNPIPPIVNLLKYCDKSSKIAEMYSALIESLVGFDEGRTALASEEGGMLAVVEVLEVGSPKSQEHALGVLLTMCQSIIYKYRELIQREGVISELSELSRLIHLGTPKSQLKARILFWLQKDPKLKLQAIEEIRQLINPFNRLSGQLSGLIDFIKPLVLMLKVNLPESLPEYALGALSELGHIGEKYKIEIVASGALEPIISFLQSQTLKLQESATNFLLLLSTSVINKPVIGSSGAIHLLVKILGHGSQQAKMNAMKVLSVLFEDPNNVNIILGTNPIPLVVDLLKKSDKSSKITEMCSALIESLVGFDEGRTSLTSVEGGVLAIVEVLKNGSLQTKKHAVGALLTMCLRDHNIILGTNPIPPMVDLLKKSDKSSKITEMCGALIECLVGFDEGRTSLTSVEGGVLAIVEVLKNGSLETKKHAVGALLTMCLSDRSKFREPTLTEGIIPELEKITVPGEPKFLLKAKTLLLLLRDSPYSQRVPRVTVYHINNNGDCVEHGIHYVTIDLKGSKELCLFVIAGEDQKSLLHHIIPDDVYGQPQDKVIKWRDLKNGTHFALRFHETTGFSYIWDRICSVQTNPHFNTLNTSLRLIGGTNSNVSWYQKVTSEWIFVIVNFILEFPSAAFDQLSSVEKPEYAQIAMVMSLVAILVCIGGLIYKGKVERVRWRSRGRIPWFYYPPPSEKRFGTFADIVGLGCAIIQFIVTTINYSFICRKANGPIKISVWPIMFAIGALCSKFLETPNKTHQD